MKVIYNNKEIGDNKNNYNRLTDKPLINSTELVGNITLNDINVYSKEEVKRLISSTRSVKVALVLPSPLTPNTTYYIGPDAYDIYTVYLTDSSDPINCFSIGTTSFGKYYSGEGINITDPQNVVSVLVDSESVIINSEGLMEARPIFEKMLPFTGADSEGDGTKGIVPKPGQYFENHLLTNASTWERDYLANILFPVGSIIFTASNTNPKDFTGNFFMNTTWTRLTADYAIMTNNGTAGGTVSQGLPNIKGAFTVRPVVDYLNTCSAPFSLSSSTAEVSWTGFQNGESFSDSSQYNATFYFYPEDSSSIYGNTTNVQPPAVTAVGWRRTA